MVRPVLPCPAKLDSPEELARFASAPAGFKEPKKLVIELLASEERDEETVPLESALACSMTRIVTRSPSRPALGSRASSPKNERLMYSEPGDGIFAGPGVRDSSM